VVHLQEILTDQGRFSRSARVIEPVDMETAIRDAASGLSAEMKATVWIGVDSSGAETGAVAGARAALLQLVTNLLVNAAESIQSAGPNAGQVTITAAPEKVQGQLMVHLRFADNGADIQAEHIGRLFQRGFSTKVRDASGYGLH
jgi:signal transduction histidine kinase